MLFLWLADLPAVGHPYGPLGQGYLLMGNIDMGYSLK